MKQFQKDEVFSRTDLPSLLFPHKSVKTYEDMTLEELEENEDEFGEEDERAMEMYRLECCVDSVDKTYLLALGCWAPINDGSGRSTRPSVKSRKTIAVA